MNPVDILLLISELEGCYQHTKKLGFDKDNELIDKMRKKYYNLYFKIKKQN